MPRWRRLWVGCTMILFLLVCPLAVSADDEEQTPQNDTAASRFERLRGWLPGHVAIRLTQGGLDEERDPDGGLGGGQLALDIRLGDSPFWISLSTEYYKKQACAVESWEIDGMGGLYVLYKGRTVTRLNLQPYAGVGLGTLTTGTGEEGWVETGALGVSARIYRKLGLCVEGRYLYSRKTEDGQRVIDFNSPGLLLGFVWTGAW